MNKPEIIEADGIMQRLGKNLLTIVSNKDSPGVTAQSTIGWVMANSSNLFYYNQIGYPLDICFNQVRLAGASYSDMEQIRTSLDAEKPKTLGATIFRDRSIQLTLAQEGKIISAMTFTSRQDVDNLIETLQAPFDAAEEIAADTMDGYDYMAIVELRSAIINHLSETSRPLPSMLQYQFAQPLPSLVISQRLYGDGSRYDEIRNENKVVHPAFCRPIGQALSQ